jgi:hypothetical protein
LCWTDNSLTGVLQEFGMSECDREASIMRPWTTRALCHWGGDLKILSMLYIMYSRCVKEGSIQASWCVVLPSVTSRVQVCSNMCFWTCKMYHFMPICNKTENKRNLSSINLNYVLKCNLTVPRI